MFSSYHEYNDPIRAPVVQYILFHMNYTIELVPEVHGQETFNTCLFHMIPCVFFDLEEKWIL